MQSTALGSHSDTEIKQEITALFLRQEKPRDMEKLGSRWNKCINKFFKRVIIFIGNQIYREGDLPPDGSLHKRLQWLEVSQS